MRRVDRIKKIILEQIKPEDCKIEIDKSGGMNGHYRYYDKTARIRCGNKKSDQYIKHGEYYVLYLLLHEICHHITWKEEWNQDAPIVGRRKSKYRRGSRYLCEYRNEKMVRRICKKYGWHEIVAAANDDVGALKKHLPFDKLSAHYLWGWDYALKRLSREENLYAQSPQG